MATEKKGETKAKMATEKKGSGKFAVQEGHLFRHDGAIHKEGKVLELSDDQAIPGIQSGALLELK